MNQHSDFAATAVIIPAAGIGSRMNSDQPKQLLAIDSISILARSCFPFLEFKNIQQLIVALHPDYQRETREILLHDLPPHHHQKLHFVIGGKTRQDSVAAGLAAVAEDIEITLVHDAARPLIDAETIRKTIRGALLHGAVIAAVPVKDTIKKVNHDQQITATVDRTPLWQAQTPQAAQTHLLKKAFKRATAKGFTGTDEASILEYSGIDVKVAYGSENNIKITRPEDMVFAKHFLTQEKRMKIGHGFDAHRLAAGRPLILGGETIEHHLGLEGHSDADVLTHALTDAILGALGRGDIGRHFPDSDGAYKDISSLILLKKVIKLADSDNMQLANADITVVCQQPRLAPYLQGMQKNLAQACGTDPANINIKATTTEQMGYTGRGEGIAAHAVVLLRSS